MRSSSGTKTPLLLAMVVAVLIVMPATVHAKKVALIIGISDYQSMRDQSDTNSNLPVGDLRGSATDARWLRQIVMDRYGFKTENVRLLVNEQATKANIVDAMSHWLPGHVDKGDSVLVYVSGHGTQVLTRGADPNELWDQAFVCYDYAPITSAAGAPASKRNIVIDNDFGKLFDKLAENASETVFIADCCYSGSMSRDPLPGLYAGKWLPPTKADLAKATTVRKDAPAAESVMDGVGDSVTFIGACADTEQASEAEMPDGKWHGAMSYCLFKGLEQATSSTDYSELIGAVRAQVQSKFRQTPQLLTKHPEWPILGGPAASVAVSAPPAVSTASATITTTTVLQPAVEAPVVTSTTTTVSQPAPPVTSITTTTVANPRTDILYVRVIARDDTGKSLAAKIGELPNIVATEANGAADRFVAVTSKGGRMRVDLTMRDGVVDATVEGSSSDEIVGGLRPFLQKAWLMKMVSSVRGSDPSLDPELIINAETPKNLSIRPVMAANPGIPVAYTGGTISFSVKPSRSCYISLVDIGTDGSMTVLLPNSIYRASDKLEAGRTYQIPDAKMGFDIVVEKPTGTEMVVAIATEQPLEWSSVSLSVDATRGGIGVVKNALDGARLFAVRQKSDVAVTTETTTTTTVATQNALLPAEGFGIAFALTEVETAR